MQLIQSQMAAIMFVLRVHTFFVIALKLSQQNWKDAIKSGGGLLGCVIFSRIHDTVYTNISRGQNII